MTYKSCQAGLEALKNEEILEHTKGHRPSFIRIVLSHNSNRPTCSLSVKRAAKNNFHSWVSIKIITPCTFYHLLAHPSIRLQSKNLLTQLHLLDKMGSWSHSLCCPARFARFAAGKKRYSLICAPGKASSPFT